MSNETLPHTMRSKVRVFEDGGIRLDTADGPRKYTVYLIDTAGCMMVGDVTV